MAGRNRILTSSCPSYTLEIKGDRPEGIVGPASCRSMAGTGKMPALLMLGVNKTFFATPIWILTGPPGAWLQVTVVRVILTTKNMA